MRLADCHNTEDFRRLAKKRLPSPIFHYIDGGADDEVTLRRNTEAFESCDLVPDVLAGVESVDLSTTVMGKRIAMPLMLSPTALQRLFHWQGERAVGRAAEKFGTWFGVSTIGTASIEEIGKLVSSPKMFQLYIHRDEGLNRGLVERCKDAGFDALALTVDTIVAGNRERDLRTGFKTPPRLTPRMIAKFAARPGWTGHYLFREKFELANIRGSAGEDPNFALSVAEYINTQMDPAMTWKTAEKLRADWGGEFCLKGVMSVGDARRAVDIGATSIMVSNHGGRQLDGGRAPFDQLAEIVDAVGDRIDVICDGGVRRGSHVLKALSVGAKACSGGRLYLYALAAGGQPGVERALGKLRGEIERGMALMGKRSVAELGRDNLRWR